MLPRTPVISWSAAGLSTEAYYYNWKTTFEQFVDRSTDISVVGTGVTTTMMASDGGDNGDTRSEATAITSESIEAGTVAEGDIDWYAFDADAGDRLYVELTAITTGYDQLRLSLHNPAGEKFGESSDVPNSYTLDRDPAGDQPPSGMVIDGNTTISGMMSSQNVDTYAVELNKGETINATIDHEYSFDMHVQLVSPETPDTRHSRYNHEYNGSE
ncbi:hypothetical protein ACFQL7_28705 [Halocatena marina]|uniref:Uncharacterized protein n=3 Tax=Halocatena marina TaxID=2934937 RepID=A0ABD5YYM9_9EURY